MNYQSSARRTLRAPGKNEEPCELEGKALGQAPSSFFPAGQWACGGLFLPRRGHCEPVSHLPRPGASLSPSFWKWDRRRDNRQGGRSAQTKDSRKNTITRLEASSLAFGRMCHCVCWVCGGEKVSDEEAEVRRERHPRRAAGSAPGRHRGRGEGTGGSLARPGCLQTD